MSVDGSCRCRVQLFPRENIFLSGIFKFVIEREELVNGSKPMINE